MRDGELERSELVEKNYCRKSAIDQCRRERNRTFGETAKGEEDSKGEEIANSTTFAAKEQRLDTGTRFQIEPTMRR